MWTLEAFDQIPYGTIFAAGKTIDSPKGINMFNTKEILYWVAKKAAITIGQYIVRSFTPTTNLLRVPVAKCQKAWIYPQL